jgi:hypothetical protein
VRPVNCHTANEPRMNAIASLVMVDPGSWLMEVYWEVFNGGRYKENQSHWCPFWEWSSDQ